MSVDIFNSSGYLTRKLINNEYLGTEGSVSWDGIDNNNTKSAVGIYIFYVTVYDINGYIKKYRKTCVLALFICFTEFFKSMLSNHSK